MKWHDKNLHWMAISSKFQTIYLKILLTWFISHELLILCLNRCQSDLTNSNKTISFFHFLAIYFDSPCNSITVNIYKILFAIKAIFTLMCYCPFKKKRGEEKRTRSRGRRSKEDTFQLLEQAKYTQTSRPHFKIT